eukprot:6772242-Alexandrium_andersonii.AAC.1
MRRRRHADRARTIRMSGGRRSPLQGLRSQDELRPWPLQGRLRHRRHLRTYQSEREGPRRTSPPRPDEGSSRPLQGR